MSAEPVRRLPIGAEVQPDGGGVHFRVWAPRHRAVDVVYGPGETRVLHLEPQPDGYFAGLAPDAAAGTRYRYRLDGGASYPDPASRYQPDGPHGPSCVVDPGAFRWSDDGWMGAELHGQVIYEMHVGAFTPEGTWAAAARELPTLAALGLTTIEMMPVADFAGRFGWGYDGVDLFAPTRLYGTPDDLRAFVDRAHAAGLAVILDVVYNHLGPDGNYLETFAPDYFSARHHTDWGKALNFDGERSAPVREFITANAACWIAEFHMDGLRLDATQNIYDASPDHILAALTRAARDAAHPRSIIVVGENEPQDTRLIRPPTEGGYGLDALWNDDYHHSARVALTGQAEAYYTDYRGAPQEFVSAAKYGYLYQGQWYRWQKQRRGTPSFGIPPMRFVDFIQNHDQIANSGRGARLRELSSPGRFRALTALTLLLPATPMLFMGEEYGATTPFYYFADHEPELAASVRAGRAEFLSQFPSLATPEMQACLPDPADPATFLASKLDPGERSAHGDMLAMTRDLLELRRTDPALRAQRPGGLDGAVLGEASFVLRWLTPDGDDRLLVVNLGRALHFDPAPEPLLAPPPGMQWRVLWSSEHPRYGGCGTPSLDTEDNWRIPGEAAVALAPMPRGDLPNG